MQEGGDLQLIIAKGEDSGIYCPGILYSEPQVPGRKVPGLIDFHSQTWSNGRTAAERSQELSQ